LRREGGVLLDSDILIAVIKEEDRLKQASLKILKAIQKKKVKHTLIVFMKSGFKLIFK